MAQSHSILKKTIQVGTSTMMSRVLGIFREFLNIKYLGVGRLSDAFVTAFSLPNMMRSIFAEGALSAAFIPVFVKTLRTKDKEHANALMTLSFLVFEGILLSLIICVAIWPDYIIRAIAWGFSADQVALTAPLLRMLIMFVFFVSSSALFAAALQAVGKFFIPAIGQVLINACIITGLLCCLFFKLSIGYLCFFIVLGGCLHTIMHLLAYLKAGFGFARITKETWREFGPLCLAFFTCALSMSVAELDYFVDRAFASYLPVGSMSLLFYANRFMAIPLGVFGVAFSTILMPHFSRISVYAPKRLSYYVLEAAKLVAWITIPISLAMAFFAEKIFTTLFVSAQFTSAQAQEAGLILLAFVIGLFFFALNKIILNVYYALRVTVLPLVVSVLAVSVNALFNYLLVGYLGAAGLALSTSISGIVQTTCLLVLLAKYYHFKVYIGAFASFLGLYALQVVAVTAGFLGLYYGILWALHAFLSPAVSFFLCERIGFWFWVGPLCLAAFMVLLILRKKTNLKLHFIAS